MIKNEVMGDNHPSPIIQSDLRICWIKTAKSLDPSGFKGYTMNPHQGAEFSAPG
jgi:hypothetical protein